MAFLLYHPELQGVSCAECKRWMVDIQTGRWSMRGGKRIPRGPKISTPCHQCPKGSPEEEPEFILSAKNWQTLQLYLEAQGTCGQALGSSGTDPIIRRNFAVLHRLFEEYRAYRLERALNPLSTTVAAMIASRPGMRRTRR